MKLGMTKCFYIKKSYYKLKYDLHLNNLHPTFSTDHPLH